MRLLHTLRDEKSAGRKGGLYHGTQIKMAFNTNRIEGSRPSEEQTRYIYETNTVPAENGEAAVNVDDVLETVNHFACFDYMLDVADEPLAQSHIKTFHAMFKANTSDARLSRYAVGEYKTLPNIVGGTETTPPDRVPAHMAALVEAYHTQKTVAMPEIVDFHFHFECIHPFQDGNGRVGRLILFKECLAHGVLPFIIEDTHKFFYYRGLKEYPATPGYLLDTCLAAQDNYAAMVRYFLPDFKSE